MSERSVWRHYRLDVCARAQREAAGGGAADPGAGRMHRGGAACRGQPVRVLGHIRTPRVPEDRLHNRLEEA